jgi:single-stranded DNA-binding protein
VKVSQNGKWYAAVDDWKPNADAQRGGGPTNRPQRQTQAQNDPNPFADDDIPF